MLTFVSNSIGSFLIGQENARVGVIEYSNNAQVVFGLTAFTDNVALAARIKTIQFIGGSTNLADALTYANDIFHASPRSFTSEVIVIITDGQSDDTVASIISANSIKALGIKIVGIVLTPTDTSNGYEEMMQLATTPDEVKALYSSDYDVLQTKLVALIYAICLPDPPAGKPLHPENNSLL